MNENRPDSSFRSADSKRKHGCPLSILAKAETGVSTSATSSTINGMRLPRLARARNSSRFGEIDCSRVELMRRLNLWRDDLRVVPNFSDAIHSASSGQATRSLRPISRLRKRPAAPLFLSRQDAGVAQWESTSFLRRTSRVQVSSPAPFLYAFKEPCGRRTGGARLNNGCNRRCRPDCRLRLRSHLNLRKFLRLTRFRSWQSWSASFAREGTKRCARGKIDNYASTPVKCRIFWPRQKRCVRATGAARRFRTTCKTVGSKSPARPTARW